MPYTFVFFLEDDGMDPEYSERSYILDSERYIGEPPKFYSSFMPAPAALVFRMHEIIVTNLKYMIPFLIT